MKNIHKVFNIVQGIILFVFMISFSYLNPDKEYLVLIIFLLILMYGRKVNDSSKVLNCLIYIGGLLSILISLII